MILVLIEREEMNKSYGEYEGFIIAADSVDEALSISYDHCKEMIDENLKIKIISDKANPDIEKGIVFFSFLGG